MAASTDQPVTNPGPVATTLGAWTPVLIVAVAHLGLLLVAMGDSDGLLVAAVETVLFGLVAVDARQSGQWSVSSLVALGVLWVGLVGGVGIAVRTGRVLVPALGLIACVALASYFLHRYELVTVGLVEEDDE